MSRDESLAAWFLAWTPPAQSFALGPHRIVTNPARFQVFYSTRIKGGFTGQVMTGVMATLRACAEKFGGPT